MEHGDLHAEIPPQRRAAKLDPAAMTWITHSCGNAQVRSDKRTQVSAERKSARARTLVASAHCIAEKRWTESPDPESDRNRIDARGVGAEQLALGLEVQTLQGMGDAIQRIGIQAGRMRKVGLEHDVIHAHRPDRVVQPLVLEPEAGIDVALEVLRRLH